MKTCEVRFCKYINNEWIGNGKSYFYNFPDSFAISGDIYDICTTSTYSNPVVIEKIYPILYNYITAYSAPTNDFEIAEKSIKEVTSIIKCYPHDNTIINNNTNINNNKNPIVKKENNNMFGMNFEFGKVPSGKFKMSIMGLAYNLGDGRYGVYNMGENEFTDVTEMTLDMDSMIYQMPIAIKDIAIGDIIKHKDKYVIVKSANESGSITVIEPINRTEVNIIPTKSVFGFNFVTKVVNLFENMMPITENNQPSEDNPFGNIMPFLMMNMLSSDNKGNSISANTGDFIKIMMFSQMMGNKNCNFDFSKNPLMALAFMK